MLRHTKTELLLLELVLHGSGISVWQHISNFLSHPRDPDDFKRCLHSRSQGYETLARADVQRTSQKIPYATTLFAICIHIAGLVQAFAVGRELEMCGMD